MNFSFVYCDTTTNGFRTELLYILGFATIIFAVLAVTRKNPIQSVLSLIGLFLSICGYFFMLDLKFISLAYLLVYVGAVAILFLFILMLINVRISELSSNTTNSLALCLTTPFLFWYMVEYIVRKRKYHRLISRVACHSWNGTLWETGHIVGIGNVMYTHVSIWLILISIILLLAMVGVIVITIKSESKHNSLAVATRSTAPVLVTAKTIYDNTKKELEQIEARRKQINDQH